MSNWMQDIIIAAAIGTAIIGWITAVSMGWM